MTRIISGPQVVNKVEEKRARVRLRRKKSGDVEKVVLGAEIEDSELGLF